LASLSKALISTEKSRTFSITLSESGSTPARPAADTLPADDLVSKPSMSRLLMTPFTFSIKVPVPIELGCARAQQGVSSRAVRAWRMGPPRR